MSVFFLFFTYSASFGTPPTISLWAFTFGNLFSRSGIFMTGVSKALYTAKSAKVNWKEKKRATLSLYIFTCYNRLPVCNLSYAMRKLAYGICEQQKRLSV